MNLLQQAQTAHPLLFLMIDEADHITGLTGLTPTVTLSKNGGSFASPAGSVSEVGSGWYKVAGNATDTGTLGPLVLHATGTGADPVDVVFEVVAFNPQDAVRLGLTALPNANAGANGGLPLAVDGSGRVDVLKINGTSQTARDIGASVLLSAGTGTGQLDFTSGVVKSNQVQIGGDTQSSTDLKDFADAGYDPATHKVQGVVLADTTTDLTNIGDVTLSADQAVNVTKVGGTTVSGPADLKADVSALATSSSITALLAKLLKYLQLLFRNDAAAPTDLATELGEINANTGTGTGDYDPTRESLQAIRDNQAGIDYFVPWCDAQLSSTLGANVFLRVWAHSGRFGVIDIEEVDAAATAEITVREYGSGSGAALFTETFAATDLVNGAFEKTHASPGFEANKLYVVAISITADGNTYTNEIPLPVGP